MKKCAFCGAQIADDEWLCAVCKEGPASRSAAGGSEGGESIPQQTQQPQSQLRPAAAPAAPVREDPPKAKTKKPANIRHSRNVFLTLFLITAVITAGCVFYIARNYTKQQQETARLRVYENDLKVREAEMDELEQELSDAQDRETAWLEEKESLNAAIDELNTQLTGTESAMSQSIYDRTAQQQQITKLEEEKSEMDTLLDERDAEIEDLEIRNQDLEEENARQEETITQMTEEAETLNEDFEELQKDYDELKEDYEELEKTNSSYKEEINFIDRYVVFVEDDGSRYYHTYDCPNFTRSNFWVYNRSLAKSSGYTACPVCGG